MLKKILSFKAIGIEAVPVTVECEVADSGIGIHLVGLADFAVKESLLRTTTALEAMGYRIPGRKIIINLTPADLRKSGCAYDLPIALAMVAASGQEPMPAIADYVVAGELGLDGSLRDIPAWYQCAQLALNTPGIKGCILPRYSAKLAARAFQGEVTVYGADSLREVISMLNGAVPEITALDEVNNEDDNYEEFQKMKRNWWNGIKGQEGAKRALEIAAAGGHPVLMVGAPGTQKSSLARAILDILPPMTMKAAMESQAIWSAANKQIIPGVRPFRAPYYAASLSALLGGGAGDNILPGEVSLTHGGVLYLEDFNNAPKALLEALRGPLEDRKIKISRLRSIVEYPADFLPVMSVLPCPCGYYGEGDKCNCTTNQREAYLSKISGPVYDRMTIQAWVHPSWKDATPGESSELVSERVAKARERQMKRQGKLNDELDAQELEKFTIDGNATEVKNFIETILMRMNFNARTYSRMLKIARTIADLEGKDQISTAHLAEAASYRFLDRKIPTQPEENEPCHAHSLPSSIPAAARG